MKYRKRTSKIKYEHGMIAGLQDLLERIEPWEEIVSVIPGEIKPAKGRGSGIRLEVKYPTSSGLKALAKNTEAVQEVFFVTKQPEQLQERLKSLSKSG
ncbi:MAG: metal-binding protein [Cyanobacteria bacterium SZAS LIN-5]|nr:metal-binding protein [Cyanobacteria bacterium SZAS LIN-5]